MRGWAQRLRVFHEPAPRQVHRFSTASAVRGRNWPRCGTPRNVDDAPNSREQGHDIGRHTGVGARGLRIGSLGLLPLGGGRWLRLAGLADDPS
eukprot:9509141-Alexandrium_andersonii.AAC.1